MKRRRRRRAVLVTGILLLLLAGGMGLWLRCGQRQYALNRQLITALVQGDDRKALALIKAGADPNTHYKPTRMPSLPELVMQFSHQSPPVNDSPNALQMVCGAVWSEDGIHPRQLFKNDHENEPLVAALVAHGANVNATYQSAWTPLMWAVYYQRINTVGILLVHGANPNVADHSGYTPLMWANAPHPMLARQNIVALLKRYGARK